MAASSLFLSLFSLLLYLSPSNLSSFYDYVDENGIEYWHSIPIESSVATKEEQEGMEKMLESFKEMEEDINW